MAFTITYKVGTQEELNRLCKTVNSIFSNDPIVDIKGECSEPECFDCIKDKIEHLTYDEALKLGEDHQSHDDPHMNPNCLLCQLYLKLI